MRPLADFSREVAPDVPDCPIDMIDKAVVGAAQDFCRKGMVWCVDLPDLLLVPNLQKYDLPVPDGSRLYSFLSAQNSEGEPVHEKSVGWLNQSLPNWRTDRGSPARYFVSDQRSSIEVVPAPSTMQLKGIQNIKVQLIPLRDSTELEDFFYEDHLEAIGFGARARLLRQPGKPWTDGKNADLYEVLFAREMAIAINNLKRGDTGRVTKMSIGRGVYT